MGQGVRITVLQTLRSHADQDPHFAHLLKVSPAAALREGGYTQFLEPRDRQALLSHGHSLYSLVYTAPVSATPRSIAAGAAVAGPTKRPRAPAPIPAMSGSQLTFPEQTLIMKNGVPDFDNGTARDWAKADLE